MSVALIVVAVIAVLLIVVLFATIKIAREYERDAAFEIGARVITATRLKERDVMNLKNLVYYLRAKLMRNDSGQDLLEYALLVALIALVCVGVITSTGSGVQSIFNDISNELKTANP
jgi:pilus assembly protein Flp/PilA